MHIVFSLWHGAQGEQNEHRDPILTNIKTFKNIGITESKKYQEWLKYFELYWNISEKHSVHKMPICTVKNIDSLCVCLPLSFQKVQKAKSKQGYRGRKLETENTLQRKKY